MTLYPHLMHWSLHGEGPGLLDHLLEFAIFEVAEMREPIGGETRLLKSPAPKVRSTRPEELSEGRFSLAPVATTYSDRHDSRSYHSLPVSISRA